MDTELRVFRFAVSVVSEGSFVCQSVSQSIGQNVHFESRTAHCRIHTDLCLLGRHSKAGCVQSPGRNVYQEGDLSVPSGQTGKVKDVEWWQLSL